MAGQQEMQTAMVNRSIRTIKAELEFLTDASVITPQTLNQLLAAIPEQTALHAPISVGAVPTTMPTVGAPAPPPMQNMSLNEKHTAPSPAPAAPPPAYGAPPSLPPSQAPLAHATALYAYRGEDPGDLDLQPNDLVMITEYTNAEWWTGRSERTGHTGIFPCSYVKLNEKQPMQNSTANNYGNLPLQTSGMGNGESAAPSKGQEMGKKFGKKMGNAAIFGAGATIGGNIVNSIF